MNKLTFPLLCKVYIILALLCAAVFSSLAYMVIGLVLLMLVLAAEIRHLPARLNMFLTTVIIFLMPLTLTSALDRITTLPMGIIFITVIILITPAVYLLDLQLQQITAEKKTSWTGKPGRRASSLFFSLITASVIIMLISPVVNKPVLLYTGIAFTIYLLVILLITLLDVPSRPLTVERPERRIVAGTSETAHIQINCGAPIKLYACIHSPDDWVRVSPEYFTFNREPAGLNVNFTPTLACQSPGPLRISMNDTRGLLEVDQELDVLKLHVIPRAKYAEWVARKYMEQSGTGTVAVTSMASQINASLNRGVEYMESRTYQPGDTLKSIDWKNTAKLNQLIVKEYRDTGGQSAIIAVNLSVTDAEAADKLAYKLISVALTMARENIPGALTAYTQDKVILETGIKEPLVLLEQTLEIIREINVIKPVNQYLAPPDLGRIKRNIRLLQHAQSGPARRLLDVFKFESRSIEESAKNNPASAALQGITRQVKGPALILLISQMNHDAEAALVTTEKLARSNFTTIPIDIN
jgi:hypothetical protein